MLRLIAVSCLMSCMLVAQQIPQAFTGGQVLPITGSPIEPGTVLIHQGKILAVGPTADVTIPSNTVRHDASGKVILPGLIDTHTHAGNVEGGDSSNSMHPGVRALDSINVRDSTIQKAQAGGITTANIMSGSGHLLSGQTVYVKYRDVKTIEDMLVYNSDGTLAHGIKMANGTNSRKDPPFPGTRAKSAALVRERFVQAIEYRDKQTQAANDTDKTPARDLGLEALSEVLAGKRVVHFHTHRHDDILTILRLAREFDFKVVLQHVSDAWLVAEEIAASPHVVGSSLILLDSPGGKVEARDIRFSSGRRLAETGALVGFHTDDPITDSRFFNRMAALAVREGMSREKALYGLTMAGAIMLGLEQRIGSLEAGKDADLVIMSGDPLSVYTKVLETWVDGVQVFNRSNPQDQLYAEGGYGATHDQSLSLHNIATAEHQ